MIADDLETLDAPALREKLRASRVEAAHHRVLLEKLAHETRSRSG